MNDPRPETAADAPAASADVPVRETNRRVHPGVDYDAPPYARDAAVAYFEELDDLLAHLAAHPGKKWVAYRGALRVGFGTDPIEFYRECAIWFADGQFCVYRIDAADKYPQDTAS